VLAREKPDVVVLAGDVNSTIAVALVASKMGLAIAHVEAGLRSRDWTMPEEINRVLTDRLSALLFTPSRDGDENLRAEGIDPSRIHLVGKRDDRLAAGGAAARPGESDPRAAGADAKGYALATLHRPSTSTRPAALSRLLSALAEVAGQIPVVFPIHPRTRSRLPAGFEARGLKLVEPLGYLDFLSLTADARLVMTDSGGIQEETTALGVPCLTMRENNERPVTVEVGTNELVGIDPARSGSGGSQGARRPGEAGPPSGAMGRQGGGAGGGNPGPVPRPAGTQGRRAGMKRKGRRRLARLRRLRSRLF